MIPAWETVGIAPQKRPDPLHNAGFQPVFAGSPWRGDMSGDASRGSAMIKTRWTKRAKHAALGGVMGLAVLTVFAHSSARAQDDDTEPNSIWNLDKRLWDSFAKGIGLK